ncbi:condensation domain-containing protein [Streptomyces sp. TLI_235]|nr:condensation domain-containing protein [Streptomyces sp. TLI_235]PBC66233.1 condensation domain-containing protein [Streptomyces sp. TLI_235]
MPELNPTRPAPGTSVPFTYEQDWFHTKTLGSGWAHKNVQHGFEILGDLDTDALLTAVRAFATRHDALHLQLPPDPGARPEQWIRPVEAHEQVVDCQNVAAASPDQFSRYASALLSRDCVTPWRYGEQRPFAIRLLRHDATRHALLATFQNLVFDGRAHHLFAHEVWRDYEAVRRGEPVPDGAPSFAQAAIRQRAATTPAQRERALADRRERLGLLARTPWLRPHGATATESGTLWAELDARATVALRHACAERRLSVLQWTVGSFVHALATRTGRTELGLWTSMDSRTSRDQDVVGMFASSCPLTVTDATGDPDTVRGQIRAQLLNALKHQRLTAREITAVTRETEAQHGAPIGRDLYLNLRRFEGDYAVHRDTGALRITADAFRLRRVAVTDIHALHLRCTEFRDRLTIALRFDGQRVGRPLARAVLDDVLAAAAATAPGPGPSF